LNASDQFYIDLDNSDWDHKNESDIISRLKEIYSEFAEAKLEDQKK